MQLDAWKSVSETPESAKKDLSNDAQIAVGIAAGYVNVIASMLGYATGCCSCFNDEEIKEYKDLLDQGLDFIGSMVHGFSAPSNLGQMSLLVGSSVFCLVIVSTL